MPYLTNLQKALDQIDSTQCAYLLISPDRVRLDRLEERLLQKLDLTDTPKTLYFGETLDPKGITEMMEELYSTNLFSAKQILQVLKADEMKASCLDAFLKAPLDSPSSNCIVLLASQLKSNSRLRKHFKSRKALIELKPIPDKELRAWAIAHGDSLRLEISGKVAELLCEIAEGKADTLHQLMTHLQMYCDTKSKPSTEDVLELFHHHPDPNEFQLLEQILTKPPLQAELTVHELLDRGKNAFLLLNLLGKSTARLLHIKSLLEQRVSREEIAQQISMPPWLFDKQVRLARQLSTSRLTSLHRSILSADSKLKGKSLGDEHIFGGIIHSR